MRTTGSAFLMMTVLNPEFLEATIERVVYDVFEKNLNISGDR